MIRKVLLMILGSILIADMSVGAEFVSETPSRPTAPVELLDMKDIDIRDALKFLAQKTGLRIVAGENVQGRLTVYAQNVNGEEALALMLRANKLAYAREGDVIRVMPEADYEAEYGRPFSQRTVSILIHLKGLKAGKAAALLENMKSSFGKVIPDDISGTVLLDDMPEKVDVMTTYIASVDHPIQSRVIPLQHIEPAQIVESVKSILTPEIGEVRFDAGSGKMFVTDTSSRLEAVERFIHEVDEVRQPVAIDLSYVKSDEILDLVKSVLTPGAGWARTGQHAHQMVVMDTPARVKGARQLIETLDRQPKEVMIEARIVQVVLKDEFRMGIDWEALIQDVHGLKLSTQWGGVGSTQKSSASIGMLSSDGYRAVLEALGSELKSHVLSNPRVAVLNDHEARILVGSSKPYVTTTTTTPTTGPATVAEDVKFIEVGVKLVVTPTIHRDGHITMRIRPEVSSAANSIRTGQNNIIPVVDTSEMETTVRIKDGTTIMLGGLIKEEEVHSGFKVPILGDVPLVGAAFRNRSSGREKTELVIFLTPRVMSGDINVEESDAASAVVR